MIPQPYVTAWGRGLAWPTVDQMEQDLVLARLIVEIANDEYLGRELVFRGGTCLHKLYLAKPLRYSEDLDYVRSSAGGIAQLTRAVTDLGERLGMSVATRMGRYPKMFLRAPFESGSGMMRVKVEVNTFERLPARPLARHQFAVDSPWFAASAEVQTFSPEELVATKLRALYQRSKGRDLFDLWLGLTEMDLAPSDLIECFGPYRPDRYTRKLAEANLREKVADPDFSNDLMPLVAAWPEDYSVGAAAELVIGRLFSLL